MEGGGDHVQQRRRRPTLAENEAERSEGTPVNPEYNGAGALVRPVGWEKSIFLGSALNLNYSTGAPPTTDIPVRRLHGTHGVPAFQSDRKFREGTMTALATYRAGAAGPPAERGIVPTAPSGFEVSVKDRAKTPEGWGYYSFDGGPTATGGRHGPFPIEHVSTATMKHAENDHVFTQYYPALP